MQMKFIRIDNLGFTYKENSRITQMKDILSSIEQIRCESGKKTYKMVERGELDEIVEWMRLDEEMLGWLELDGSPEVANSEGDCTAEVNIARVSQKSDPSKRPMLDRRLRRLAGNRGSRILIHLPCAFFTFFF